MEWSGRRGTRGGRRGGRSWATRAGGGLGRWRGLGGEPGGDAFIERMGSPMGDWLVDWVFGDVHTRDGLSAPARELIIAAVLTAIGGAEPQVAAHIRALRAIDVPWQEIEETILQTTPYAGFPRAVNAMKVLRAEQEAAEGRQSGTRAPPESPASAASTMTTSSTRAPQDRWDSCPMTRAGLR